MFFYVFCTDFVLPIFERRKKRARVFQFLFLAYFIISFAFDFVFICVSNIDFELSFTAFKLLFPFPSHLSFWMVSSLCSFDSIIVCSGFQCFLCFYVYSRCHVSIVFSHALKTRHDTLSQRLTIGTKWTSSQSIYHFIRYECFKHNNNDKNPRLSMNTLFWG